MSETRRLAAILAADVAGYSRLMGDDETGTALQALGGRHPRRNLCRAPQMRVPPVARIRSSFDCRVRQLPW